MSNAIRTQAGCPNAMPSVTTRLRQWFLILFALASALGPGAAMVRGQGYLDNIGVPPFTTSVPIQNGFVNVANGNFHLEIPLGSFPQRGGKTDNVVLMYDSAIWKVYSDPDDGSLDWVPTNISTSNGTSNSWGGWRLVTSGDTGAYSYTEKLIHCSTYYDLIDYRAWIYTEANGTQHSIPITTTYYPPPCSSGGDISTANAIAPDASGIEMFVNNYTSAKVYFPDGTKYQEGTSLALAPPTDSNGNSYSLDSNGNIIDTLKRTPVKTTVSGSTVYYDVSDSRGSTRRYTIALGTVNLCTNFGVVGDGGGGGDSDNDDTRIIEDTLDSFQAITSIAMPDGTSYSFTYDSGTSCSPATYGLLTSMKVPTGDTIYYTFANVQDATSSTYRTISSIQDPYGTWDFSAPSILTSCTIGQADCQQQVTVTKPSGDNTVFTFTLNDGAWPTEVQYYTGSVSSANLLSTTTQCYNFVTVTSGSCSYSVVTLATSPPYQLLAATTTLPLPSSGSVSATTEYTWDSNKYGDLLTKSEWNFGHSPTGNADRTTTTTYLGTTSYINENIFNRPATITVTNASGGTVSETNNCYDGANGSSNCTDGSSITPATGYSQHDDTDFGTGFTTRGNLTQVQRLISGTSNFLTQSMVYDMTGQMVSGTDWNSNPTTYGYADNFYTDGGDSSAPSSYTPGTATNAYLTSISYPTVNSVTLVDTFGYYWGTGQKALSTDPNSQTTDFHFYDYLNRPTSTELPNSGWNYSVYASSSETQVDTGMGITSTSLSVSCTGGAGDCRHDQTLLDGLGHVTSKILVSDPEGQTTVGTVYDSDERVYSVSNPHRTISSATDGTTYYSYDGLNRTTQVLRPDGIIAYTYYGPAVTSGSHGGRTGVICSGYVGYPILYVDEASKLRQTWTDGFGRLIEVDEPDPSTGSLTSGSPKGTCYSYDLNNNLTGVTQGSLSRSFSYDMLSRLTAATNPESGTINYYYTASGGGLCSGDMSGVCRRTDARSTTTTYAYDALNRLISKSYSDSTPGVAYGYDAVAPSGCTPPSLTITNGKGRRTGMCDGPGGTSWSYDQVGNVLTEERTTNGATDSFAYTYNLDSTEAKVTYPSSRAITYQPGGAQRPLWGLDTTDSINYAWGPCTNSTSTTGTCYAPPGELSSLNNGASLISTAYYNNRLQPCRVSVKSSGTAPSPCSDSSHNGNVMDLAFNFNAGSSDNGNVIGITNNKDTTRSQTFTYDKLNRIATAETTSTYSTSTANCWSELYTEDALGNLTSIAAPSGSYPSNPYGGCMQESGFSITVNSSNQDAGSCYDAAGNKLGAAGGAPPSCSPLPTTYSYNAENQLTSTAGVTYYYDGDGQRVQKGSAMLYWYGTSPAPLLETNGSGGLTYEYIFFGGGRVARRDSSGNVDYYFADQLGTARVVTDSSGTILDESDFYPFGGERDVTGPSSGNTYKFTGKERDSESGLDNFGARYDSSQYGRFMTPDPDEVSGLSHIEDPQAWNGYAYARNNPLLYTDPDGLSYYVCIMYVDVDGNSKNTQNCSWYDNDIDFYKAVNGSPGASASGGNIYANGQIVGSYQYFGPSGDDTRGTNNVSSDFLNLYFLGQTVRGAVSLGRLGYEALAGVLGKEAATGAAKATVTVEDLLQGAVKDATGQPAKSGGFAQATKDFAALDGEAQNLGRVQVKVLPDGTKAVLRNFSTDGRATLEFQPASGGSKTQWIRYNP